MKIFGYTIAVGKAAAIAAAAVVTEGQELVAGLKGTLGDTIRADIATMAGSTLTGEQKMAEVVGRTVPLLVAELGAGTIEADAKDIARELVQSLYNDGRAVLKALAAKVLG